MAHAPRQQERELGFPSNATITGRDPQKGTTTVKLRATPDSHWTPGRGIRHLMQHMAAVRGDDSVRLNAQVVKVWRRPGRDAGVTLEIEELRSGKRR